MLILLIIVKIWKKIGLLGLHGNGAIRGTSYIKKQRRKLWGRKEYGRYGKHSRRDRRKEKRVESLVRSF